MNRSLNRFENIVDAMKFVSIDQFFFEENWVSSKTNNLLKSEAKIVRLMIDARRFIFSFHRTFFPQI